MTRASWSSARRLAHEAGAARRAELAASLTSAVDDLPLAAALGRVLAAPLVSPIAIPHYASSAMDGWAVSGPGPWTLLDAADAERSRSEGLSDGEAVEVLTGGSIPARTSAVLRSESGVVDRTGDRSRLDVAAHTPDDEVRAGRHIREAGTEAPAGTALLDAGTMLGPVHLAVAAGAGFDRVPTERRPRVRLVFTGDEVVESGVPWPGFVRDSFGPSLPGVIAALGGEVVQRTRVGDDADATARALRTVAVVVPDPTDPGDSADPSDLIVTTGGTGASRADHVRAHLRSVGAEFLVDGVDARPGGPAILARLADGRLVVCLPGNPLAALLSVLTLVHPLLAALQGLPVAPLRPVVLDSAIDPARAGTLLRPYRSVQDEDSATVAVAPTPWHGAAMLRGLADADGVLVCPGTGAAAGTLVPSLDLPW